MQKILSRVYMGLDFLGMPRLANLAARAPQAILTYEGAGPPA